MKNPDNVPFRDELFDDPGAVGTYPPMTVHGTIDKALFLILIVSVSAVLTWTYIPGSVTLMLGAVICAFVVGFVTSFRTSLSPFTAPLFALLEGAFLGGFSGWMETLYPGIVVQALVLAL